MAVWESLENQRGYGRLRAEHGDWRGRTAKHEGAARATGKAGSMSAGFDATNQWKEHHVVGVRESALDCKSAGQPRLVDEHVR